MTAPFSPQTLRDWSELSVQAARTILPLVFALTEPASVVDVGCLFGGWAAVSRELGVADVVGVDGDYVDPATLLIARERFLARDLALPLRLGRRFDLAINLEVAQMLPASRAEGFVADLCRLAPAVLFSAAIPHQGGIGHVNEQWPAYWARLFAARGYVPVDCVRDEVWENPAMASWYAQNTLLFVSADVRPAAIVSHPGFGRCPARVHPSVYLRYADGRYQALRRRAGGGLAKVRRG